MPRTRQNFITDERNAHAHYIIDGTKYMTMQEVYCAALNRGSTHTFSTIRNRLRRGETTWAALLRPTDPNQGLDKRKENIQRKHDEMRKVCEELDARKKAMGLEYAY